MHALEHPALHTDTVRLSSNIVEGKEDKHMIFLHGLFGNKSTFRYLANNEMVRSLRLKIIDKRSKDMSFD